MFSVVYYPFSSDTILNTKERNLNVEERKSFEFKPRMLVALLAVTALFLVASNFDPVGNWLEKIFGKGAGRWTTNIVLMALIVYVFIKKK